MGEDNLWKWGRTSCENGGGQLVKMGEDNLWKWGMTNCENGGGQLVNMGEDKLWKWGRTIFENGGGQLEKHQLQTTWTWLFVTWLNFFKICTSFSIIFCCSCSCSLPAIARCWALTPGCPRAHCTGNWKSELFTRMIYLHFSKIEMGERGNDPFLMKRRKTKQFDMLLSKRHQ